MSEGCCRPGRWLGSNRPPRGESRGAGTAHAQRRASALQRADHRGLSERVPVAFTWSELMTSEGRSPLAGDFVGARPRGQPRNDTPGRSRALSPASGLHPPSRSSRSGRSLLAGVFVGARPDGRPKNDTRGRSRSPSPASGLLPPSR